MPSKCVVIYVPGVPLSDGVVLMGIIIFGYIYPSITLTTCTAFTDDDDDYLKIDFKPVITQLRSIITEV